MEAVVGDLDGDLSVGQVGSDEGGLDFDRDLFPGVQNVSAQKNIINHPLVQWDTPQPPDQVSELGLLSVLTVKYFFSLCNHIWRTLPAK